jgi:hypothetical protein
LTYLWTAEPDDGVVFDPPSADVNDPNVTIIKPLLVSNGVSIVNQSFESPTLLNGAFVETTPPGWGWFANDGANAVWNPGSGAFGGNAPEGQNIAYVDPAGVATGAGIAQVLSETFVADTTYILTVEVGDCPYYEWGSYKVQLLAGGALADNAGEITAGTLLAEDDSLTPGDDTFATSTVTYTYDSGDSALLGQNLQIRLLGIQPGGAEDGEVDFDDVRLIAVGPAPDLYTVTLKLSVNDESNTPDEAVDDIMTIDVYDTACEAAIGAGLTADNPGDFDGNCITDANDLKELAEKWLKGNPLTEAVAKP